LLAASVLLERSALLTRDAASEQTDIGRGAGEGDAGALDAALRLLPAVEAEPASDLRTHLPITPRSDSRFDQRRGADAARYC